MYRVGERMSPFSASAAIRQAIGNVFFFNELIGLRGKNTCPRRVVPGADSFKIGGTWHRPAVI
jgi:hypothetical protein